MTLSEYRADFDVPPDMSSDELVNRLLDGSAKPVRTIRIPTLSDCEALFRAGEQIRLPERMEVRMESGATGQGEALFLDVGTILRVTAKRTSSSVLMQFDYTTSRLASEDAAGSMPRVQESTVQGTYSFSLGEPALAGGITASDGFYLVVTVSEPESPSETNP